ncbi:D-glycerate dehydrogenase [Mycolicibacterium sp. S2-37]|uniref:2-hydroxyacid dehydrogenase n=1 Tax=Mycolicibacterium sp. S2-37 TaxID=2810297 RepID=UPI0027DA4090|nr:D-glycerate dehydrogenase [Mycolicibacterium sp. S2-37]
MTTSGHVYVTRLLTDRAMDRLAELGRPLRVGGENPPSRSELERDIAGACAAVVTITERIDADVLAAAGDGLQVIANVAVGFDNIDVAAAATMGVTVTNTPGVLDNATADHTFALILAASRRLVEGDRFLRSGQAWVWGPRMMLGLDVSAGATLGILGYGRIARAVARRARAFDMRVLATSRSRTSGDEDGVRFVDADTLLAASDVVCVLTPLTPETRHLIDAAALARMKPTAYLVNTARGGVVDESALVDALTAGRISGAALDVFDNEPHVDPALLAAPNLVLTPHIASAGAATRDAMGVLAVDNVAAVLTGRPALNPVR